MNGTIVPEKPWNLEAQHAGVSDRLPAVWATSKCKASRATIDQYPSACHEHATYITYVYARDRIVIQVVEIFSD